MKKIAQLFALPLIVLAVIVDIVVANLLPTSDSIWQSVIFMALNLLAGAASCFVLWESGKLSLQRHSRQKVD